MFSLDFGDSRPLYEQIKEKIRELIISNALKEGEQIPSVRELALQMAIKAYLFRNVAFSGKKILLFRLLRLL